MKNNINTYLRENIPFALFRIPNQSVRLVAQFSPLATTYDFEETGFHFAPFSDREKVPHLVIKDETIPLGGADFFSKKRITLQRNKNTFPEINFTNYKKDLETYFDFFEKNNIQKAIYSRIKKTTLSDNPDNSDDFELLTFFEKIEKTYPRAMVYLVHLPDWGIWIGASPEKLLRYKNGIAETVALAGTQKLSAEKKIENLTWEKKETEEHQMVADYIFQKIKKHDLQIIQQSEIYTSQAGAVAHLKQRFEFEITKKQLPDFIQDLHPTPAVCGLPKEKALDLIYSTERHAREYYAGYLGMVEKDTIDFYVNLRCMKIDNNEAALFVGGGITADSIPEKEWEETELKAKTLLNIVATDFSRVSLT